MDKKDNNLMHEWDDDGICINCGHDGAEEYHLIKIGRMSESDRSIKCPVKIERWRI